MPTAFIRNTNATIYLEVFFVFAVATILLTRLFLHLAGYPQISGGGLHIAHLLPGGILMLIAIIFLLTYLNHQARWVSAIVGGIGFGLFIDEFGKFITSTNDYFFQPTIALIYVVFVLLFFLFRRLSSNRTLTDETYVVNAIELCKDIFINDFDESEKTRTLEYLKHGDQHNPLIHTLIKTLQDIPAKPAVQQPFIRRIAALVSARYDWAVRRAWFIQVAIAFFALNAAIGIAQAITNLITYDTFAAWGALLFASIAALFITAGIALIWKNRTAAYAHFRMALMILILFTQFFIFFDDELSAITGLLMYLIGLLAIDTMIKQETTID